MPFPSLFRRQQPRALSPLPVPRPTLYPHGMAGELAALAAQTADPFTRAGLNGIVPRLASAERRLQLLNQMHTAAIEAAEHTDTSLALQDDFLARLDRSLEAERIGGGFQDEAMGAAA